jgi:hypothetical protein
VNDLKKQIARSVKAAGGLVKEDHAALAVKTLLCHAGS